MGMRAQSGDKRVPITLPAKLGRREGRRDAVVVGATCGKTKNRIFKKFHKKKNEVSAAASGLLAYVGSHAICCELLRSSPNGATGNGRTHPSTPYIGNRNASPLSTRLPPVCTIQRWKIPLRPRRGALDGAPPLRRRLLQRSHRVFGWLARPRCASIRGAAWRLVQCELCGWPVPCSVVATAALDVDTHCPVLQRVRLPL